MAHASLAHAKPKGKAKTKAAHVEPPSAPHGTPALPAAATAPDPPLAHTEPSMPATQDAAPLQNIGISGMLYLGVPGGGYYETLSIGALVRGTYVLTPQIVASGRIGFVYGLPRTYSSKAVVVGVGGTLSAQTYEASYTWAYVPILLGGRYYLDKARTGLHGDAELGIYPVWAGTSSNYAGYSGSGSAMSVFAGINLGVGYVLPGKLPLDLMVEWSNQVGLGLSAGLPLL